LIQIGLLSFYTQHIPNVASSVLQRNMAKDFKKFLTNLEKGVF
jgi:hypothetical protein